LRFDPNSRYLVALLIGAFTFALSALVRAEVSWWAIGFFTATFFFAVSRLDRVVLAVERPEALTEESLLEECGSQSAKVVRP
jgi:hypothetical protein